MEWEAPEWEASEAVLGLAAPLMAFLGPLEVAERGLRGSGSGLEEVDLAACACVTGAVRVMAKVKGASGLAEAAAACLGLPAEEAGLAAKGLEGAALGAAAGAAPTASFGCT
jgi:hypothetical protein